MTKGTIIRTVFFALALINQMLVVFGNSPIPLSKIEINDIVVQLDLLISTLITTATGLWAWWKNNSFTKAAIESDKFLLKLKKRDR